MIFALLFQPIKTLAYSETLEDDVYKSASSNISEKETLIPFFDPTDLTIPSGVTVEELSAGILTSMRPLAPYFVKAEKEFGVNAIFLSAIAGIESSWATSDWAKTDNNLFGYDDRRYFESKEDCIIHVAKKLKEAYLTENGTYYYHGKGIYNVEFYYCNKELNNGISWGGAVQKIMTEIANRIVTHKNLNGENIAYLDFIDIDFEARENESNPITEYFVSMQRYKIGRVVDNMSLLIEPPTNVASVSTKSDSKVVEGGRCIASGLAEKNISNYKDTVTSQLKSTIS